MVDFYVVRHGLTEYNVSGKIQGWCDAPLTPEGVDKAIELGKVLSSVRFDAAFSSDLYRAVHTKQLILKENQQPPKENRELPELREMNFGNVEAKPFMPLFEEIAKEHGYQDAQSLIHEVPMLERLGYLYDPKKNPEAESTDKMLSRVRNAFLDLGRLASQQGIGRVLIVTHGVVITAALKALTDSSEGAMSTSVPNVSVTRLQYSDDQFIARYVGITAEALNPSR